MTRSVSSEPNDPRGRDVQSRYRGAATAPHALAVLAVLAALASFGSTAMAQGGDQRLVVFAASSLTESFESIAAAFEASHEGVEVDLSFGGSSTLSTQIVQGAPADVFASADELRMAVVVDAGLVEGAPRTFAGNELVVITPQDSAIATLSDLAEDGVRLVLAGPEVPVGNYSRIALDRLDALLGDDYSERVLANLVSEEPNVRQVAAKVELGEADAAIVYATDAAILKAVRVLPIPDAANVRAVYPIAVLTDAEDPDLAATFVDFVLAPDGQAILADRGFAAP